MKGSQKSAKSLLTNNSHNPGLGEGVTKTTGERQIYSLSILS